MPIQMKPAEVVVMEGEDRIMAEHNTTLSIPDFPVFRDILPLIFQGLNCIMIVVIADNQRFFPIQP